MTKKNLLVLAFTALLLPTLASANGLSLNGLGTRAQGMGGAFVSIADDFSAVFWNPAGAAGFRQTTFGFYASDLMPRMTYSVESEGPDVNAKTKISHYLSFLAGYYKPVSDRLVLGIGIGTPSAQGVMWNGSDLTALSNGTAYDWSSRLYVFSFSPMAAVKISDAISFGAALNIHYGNIGFKMPYGMSYFPGSVQDPPQNVSVDLGQFEETANGWGVGATFGLLVKPMKRLALGLTVRTPLTIVFDGTASLSNMPFYGLPGSSALECRITWPLGIAGGVSFRPIDRLLLSADVLWTRWSKLYAVPLDFEDPVWADLCQLEGKPYPILDWRNTAQIRFGMEYRFNPSTAVRAGYSYDPAPGPDWALDVLKPTFTGDAFTVGLGKTFGGLQLDFGLEYFAGHKRARDMPIFVNYVMTMHAVVPSVSASYKF